MKTKVCMCFEKLSFIFNWFTPLKKNDRIYKFCHCFKHFFISTYQFLIELINKRNFFEKNNTLYYFWIDFMTVIFKSIFYKHYKINKSSLIILLFFFKSVIILNWHYLSFSFNFFKILIEKFIFSFKNFVFPIFF